MTKKGGKVRKSSEIIYKLSRDPHFREDVRKLRVEVGIPIEGFKDEAEEWEWNRNHMPALTLFEAPTLLAKYALPPAYYWETNQYIRFNRVDTYNEQDAHILSVRYPNDPENSSGKEALFRKWKMPYVSLYIHDASSKEEITKILRKYWPHIQGSLAVQGGIASRVRKSENKERALMISELYEKTKQELISLIEIDTDGIENASKEGLIVRIMHARGYPEVTFEMVKKYTLTPKLPTDKSRLKSRSVKKKKLPNYTQVFRQDRGWH